MESIRKLSSKKRNLRKKGGNPVGFEQGIEGEIKVIDRQELGFKPNLFNKSKFAQPSFQPKPMVKESSDLDLGEDEDRPTVVEVEEQVKEDFKVNNLQRNLKNISLSFQKVELEESSEEEFQIKRSINSQKIQLTKAKPESNHEYGSREEEGGTEIPDQATIEKHKLRRKLGIYEVDLNLEELPLDPEQPLDTNRLTQDKVTYTSRLYREDDLDDEAELEASYGKTYGLGFQTLQSKVQQKEVQENLPISDEDESFLQLERNQLFKGHCQAKDSYKKISSFVPPKTFSEIQTLIQIQKSQVELRNGPYQKAYQQYCTMDQKLWTEFQSLEKERLEKKDKLTLYELLLTQQS